MSLWAREGFSITRRDFQKLISFTNLKAASCPPLTDHKLTLCFLRLDANTVLERQAELPCLRRCLALKHVDVGGPLLPYGCSTFRQPPDAESAFAVRVPVTLPPALLQFLIQRPAEVELFTQYLRENALQVELDARLLAANKTGRRTFAIMRFGSLLVSKFFVVSCSIGTNMGVCG